MKQNIASLLLLVLCLGLGWAWHLENQQTQALSKELSQTQQNYQKEHQLRLDLEKEKTAQAQRLAQQAQSDQADLQRLTEQYRNEQQKLEEARRVLEELHTRRKGGDSAVWETRLHSLNESAKNLQKRLKDLQGQEHALTQEGNATLKEQKYRNRQTLTEATAQIKLQEQALKDVQKEITYWKKRIHDINQPMRLQELAAKQETLSNDLAQMKAERTRLSQQGKDASGQTQNDINDGRQDLRDSQEQIKAQLASVTAEIEKTQNSLNNSKKTTSNYQQMINEAQAKYDEQMAKTKASAEALQRKQQEIQSSAK